MDHLCQTLPSFLAQTCLQSSVYNGGQAGNMYAMSKAELRPDAVVNDMAYQQQIQHM